MALLGKQEPDQRKHGDWFSLRSEAEGEVQGSAELG